MMRIGIFHDWILLRLLLSAVRGTRGFVCWLWVWVAWVVLTLVQCLRRAVLLYLSVS